MIRRIYINKHIIRSNLKLLEAGAGDELLKPITIAYGNGKKDKAMGFVFQDREGNELGRFIYRPLKPLSCGATVWFESRLPEEQLLILPVDHPVE